MNQQPKTILLGLGLLAALGAIAFRTAKSHAYSNHPSHPPAPPPLEVVPLPPGCVRPTFVNTLGLRLMKIPKGRFSMGVLGNPSEEPVHEVILTKDFYLGATEVTQAQFEAATGLRPSHFQGAGASAPVEQVSLADAEAFCRVLSQREGRHYRLPTEAEWEYACRAGDARPAKALPESTNQESHDPALDAIAWTCANSGVSYEGGDPTRGWPGRHPFNHAGTHPVAQKAANPWGLYDMLGNVEEWCSDFWGDYPDAKSLTDPCAKGGPYIRTYYCKAPTFRVIRGGNYSAGASSATPGTRHPCDPFVHSPQIGFRVVLEGDPTTPAGRNVKGPRPFIQAP